MHADVRNSLHMCMRIRRQIPPQLRRLWNARVRVLAMNCIKIDKTLICARTVHDSARIREPLNRQYLY